MRGIVIHCPSSDCKKLLLKNASLIPGTSFEIKCYWCGKRVKVASDNKRITLEDMEKDRDDRCITAL